MGYYEDVYLKRLNRYGVDFQSRLQCQREENFHRNISFNERTAIKKENMEFNLDIYPLCFKFCSLDDSNKE